MLKQFNLSNLTFDDPIIVINDDDTVSYQTNGDGWYPVLTEDDVNAISATITGGGEVYADDGELKWSGKAPDDAHIFDTSQKKWIINKQMQAELKAQMLTQFITNIDDKAASIYQVWTRFEQEYAQRESAAIVFKASNYQGEVSRFIADFAEKAGIDNKTATDLILQQAESLRKLLVELANQRMRKYELKKEGLTEAEMQSIYDDIIQQMGKLAEAHQNG